MKIGKCQYGYRGGGGVDAAVGAAGGTAEGTAGVTAGTLGAVELTVGTAGAAGGDTASFDWRATLIDTFGFELKDGGAGDEVGVVGEGAMVAAEPGPGEVNTPEILMAFCTVTSALMPTNGAAVLSRFEMISRNRFIGCSRPCVSVVQIL